MPAVAPVVLLWRGLPPKRTEIEKARHRSATGRCARSSLVNCGAGGGYCNLAAAPRAAECRLVTGLEDRSFWNQCISGCSSCLRYTARFWPTSSQPRGQASRCIGRACQPGCCWRPGCLQRGTALLFVVIVGRSLAAAEGENNQHQRVRRLSEEPLLLK